MRTDNPEFASENLSQWREPRFVFVLDFGEDDVFYLTSHPVIGLSGENVIAGVLVSASGTSQKLDPLKANSEIGAISFDVLDDGLTELQREKLLEEDKGLRGKTVRFYVGGAGLDWSDYILATTQVIESVSYKDLSYKFKCADIQRAMREDILEPLETGLAESLTLGDDHIRVFNTSGFGLVQQLDIPGSVAPNKKIGLVTIEGDGDQSEIIAYDAVEPDRFIIASTRTNTTAATQAGDSYVMLGAAAANFRSAGSGVIRTLESDGQGGQVERLNPFTWTGRNNNALTGCTGVVAAPLNSQVRDLWGRGMFGTPIQAVERSEDTGSDSAPTVTEFIYLEMPAPMAAYALLTGSIYGRPGEYLPDHWHLGIGPQFIRTTEFTGIGDDLWDLSNDDAGLVVRLMGLESEDGKQFIEEQLFRLMGCFAPVYSDGQIGLRRMTGVLSSGGYVRRLNEDNVVDYGDLVHDMKATVNTIIARWNYSLVREEYTRKNLLIDDESIQRHGEGDPLDVEFRGLYGGRHSYQTLWTILNSLRDRYAGPPLRITLTLTPDQNDLEVGDIVRVDLGAVRDYTNDETIHLNRNFEIQQIQTDWRTGRVRVTLFGSSQKAGPLRPEQAGLSIPDAAFHRGTEISPGNFGSAVTRSGTLTRIISNVVLAGAASMEDEAACFWVPQDLEIAPGVTVTAVDNVALLVPGFFENNGVIDGVGRGHQGGLGTSSVAIGAGGWYRRGSVWNEVNRGKPGYLSINSVPQGGTAMEVRGGQSQVWPMDNDGSMRTQGAIIGGVLAPGESLPLAEPYDGQGIGLPMDLRGGSGSGGGSIVRGGRSASGLLYLGDGGRGGNGGAGLMIVCRGMDQGLNARIDLSGTAGELPDNGPWNNGINDYGKAMAGAGGPGGPGACYIFIDGTTNNPPSLNHLNAIADGGDLVWAGTRYPVGREFRIDGSGRQGVWSSGIGPAPQSAQVATSPAPGVIFWEGAYLVRILTGSIAADPDVPTETENPLRVYLSEITNTPRSANANLSTIEVGVDPPSISNYRYAWVQYRPAGEQGWFDVGPASPEVSFVVSSDGTTYEVRALGVSRDGRRLPDAPIHEITTTRILQPGEPPVDDDEPEVVARVPDVSGLELFEQGHDTEFGGRDAKFVWRKTSVTEWFEIGSEGRQGAGAGALDLYFKDYQVEVWAGTQLLRTEWVVDPEFIYSFEKNAEDYYRIHGAMGSWREFECRVYCRGRQNQLSTNAARLIVENPAPGLPDQITLSASLRSVQIEFQAPDDLDYKHTRVWLSTTQGFVPSDDTLAAQVDGSVAIQGLTDGTTYYIRLASYDAFGQGVMSPEFTITTQTIQVDDVEGLPEDLAGIGGDLTAIQEDLNGAMDELADQAQELADAGNAIINLQDDYQSLDGTVSGHTLAIIAADARIEDTEEGLVAQGQQITLIEAGLQTVTDEVVAAQETADQAALDAAAAAGIAEGKGKVIIQPVAPAVADQLPQNLWIDTAGGANTPKRWTGSAWEPVTDQAAIDAADAAAQAQADATQALIEASAQAGLIDGLTVRVSDTEDGLAAEAARLTGVESRVGDNEAGVSQLMNTTAGLEAQYVLAVRSGGVVTGMKIAAGEDISRIVFETGELLIIPVGGDPDDDALAPFLYDGEWVRIDKLKVGSINYDDNSVDLATKVTGQIRGENIEDGAVINITETTASPNTQIFDGSDFDVWKEVATLDVQVLGDGSALALQFHFSFDLDQVTEAWGQAGPGGPMVELRLRRGGVTVWNPDAVMVSGSGRVALQFGAKIDTGMTAGLQTYVVEVLWSKGTYDAGTVDYRVQWNAAGEATILANIAGGGQGLVFNGAFPTTYLGAGWEITFIGTGAVPYPITSAPAVFHPLAQGVPTAGWADWRTYSGISVRAPLLDRPPEPAGSAILTDQPYEAENHQHKIIGSLTYYWIRALEYRG